MLIIHGTKRADRRLGQVADFCALCRGLRAFELSEVATVDHVYYIGYGKRKLAGYVIKCRDCGVMLHANFDKYAMTEPGRATDLEALIHKTHPGLRAAQAERLAMEEQVKRSPASLPPERREALLMEPFILMDGLVTERFNNSTEFDRQSGWGCIGTVFLPFIVFIVAFQFRRPTQEKILVAAAILAGVGALYTLVQMHFAPSRYVYQRVLPPLANSLEALQPTHAEIAESLVRCKALGLKVGKVLKPARVCAACKALPG